MASERVRFMTAALEAQYGAVCQVWISIRGKKRGEGRLRYQHWDEL
jgi:hypothetical protein